MNLDNIKVTVTDVGGSYRDVADAARTTIGLEEGNKEVSDNYMLRMYRAEHSPIRLREFKIVIENCPSWVATHFVRHHIGVEKFVSTQRTDRTGVDRNSKPQDSPVNLAGEADAQALINISRRRLCNCASSETRQAWQEVKDKVAEVEPELASCMVKECIYRGFCPEMFSCGYDKTEAFQAELKEYRKGINGNE